MDAAGTAGVTPIETLRAAGLRATTPRARVLSLLETLGGHRSVDELADALEQRGEPLPRTTIYNVVSDLSEAGLVMMADAGPGRALYEAGTVWHHHFVCRNCQAVLDVPCEVGEKPCLEASLAGADIEEAQVIYRGVCADCLMSRRGKEETG